MTDSKYWLDRSYLSTARLNLQHYIWTQSVGFLIHPTIQPCVTESSNIADVATGTGIWLLNLAQTLPALVQLRGFDVDLSQICAKEWLPPNVSMHQWDMFEDIPAEHKGKYDMVNIRFVVPVVHQDPTPILLRLMSMLKPGGWLQWMEQDPYTFKPRTALPNTSIPATQKLHDLLHGQLLEQVGPAPGWIGNLPNLFNAVNLVKVDKYDVKMPDWALSHFQDTVLMALDEMAPHFSTLDLKTATADGAREMFALKRGVASSGDCVIVIGQKPLDP